MAEKTVRMVYIAWWTKPDDEGFSVQEMTMAGYTVDTDDMADGEFERLDELGAFTDSPDVPPDSMVQYFGAPQQKDPESGLPHGEPNVDVATASSESAEGLMPVDMTDEQIDDLTGDDLDDACDAAGIDTSSGGSLSDGSLSADEKRAALKAA
jgi:hypothetical protein